MRRDGGTGTTLTAVEKFAGDAQFNAARAAVKDAMADVVPANDYERAMKTHGVWNAHEVAWNDVGAFAVEEVTDGGVHILRPRFSVARAGAYLKRIADSAREYATLLALAQADELALDAGNIFLNLGTEHLWRRVTGVGTQDQLFDNAHARIGVGNSSTAAARTQTDLQGASKTYKGMEASFPTITAGDGSGGAKATFKSVFGSAEANHDHAEWVVDNKNDPAGSGGANDPGVIVMNRKVQNFGTKASGSTWTYTFELQIN